MGSVRKVNYSDTWNDQKVISMYQKLKDCVDDGLKMKRQGARKRLCLPRELEPIVREIFLKKRGITFRNDIGGCEAAKDSQHFPEADWSIKGWFDAAKICVNVLLKSDFKRANSSSGAGGAGGGLGGRAGGNAHAHAGGGGVGGGGGKRAAEAGAAASGAGGPSSSSQKQPLRDGFRVPKGAKENRKRALEQEAVARPGPLGRQGSWPLPSQHPSQDPHSYSAAASADASGQQQQQQPRIKLPRTPSFSGGASRPQAAREPLFDPTEVAPTDERVPVYFLTTWGAARMVEDILRKLQPSWVHWGAHYTASQKVVAEGLTGQDIANLDVGTFMKGPGAKHAAVSAALEEYRKLGGVPRNQVREWGQAPPGQPLPAPSSSSAAASEPPSQQQQQQQQQPSAGGGRGGGSRNGWGAPPIQPKQERPSIQPKQERP